MNSDITILNMENGSKFDVKECVRMTSIVCSSENQVRTQDDVICHNKIQIVLLRSKLSNFCTTIT